MTEVYNPKAVFPHAASLHQAFAHCAISPTAASRRSLGRVSVPMWPFNLSSPNVAVQPLSPATDRRLGEPLPHQLSNRTRAHLQADCSFDLCAMRHCGLMRYYHPFPGAIPLLKAGCSRVTHPSATKNTGHLPEGFSPVFSVRLACVRRAASVRPEPGSNS